MVAYSTQAKDYLLWTYEIGGRGAVPLEGTQGASYPFWSPDSRSIGFFADGKLKRIDLPGGQIQLLCDASNGRGGTWNRDGVILFAPNSLGGLSRISAQGGPSSIITSPDSARSETSHRWPVFLPDGNHFLYLGVNFSGRSEMNAVFLAALDSKEKRLLVNASSNAAYSDSGFLIYMRDRVLVAQAFDGRSAPQGEMRTVTTGVLYSPQVDRAVFSAVGGRALIAQTGTSAALSQLIWFDRNGKSTATVGPRAWYDNVRLSPDGRRIATDETDPNGSNVDIWIHDPARNTNTRLTFDRTLHQTPIWNPEGTQVLFGANPDLKFQLFLKNADGSGMQQSADDLGSPGLVNPWDWSRDGRYILFRRQNELWYMTWPDRTSHQIFAGEWTVRNAQFSPDGRWIAYASNETGKMEIFVTPFPPAGSKWQISTAGGQEPRWRQNGKELFYLSPDGKMMAVAVTAGASFAAGPPVILFQTNRRQAISSQDVFSYDVSSDGQRFLIVTHMDEGGFVPPSVILNWALEPEE
jgi:Tol biopolymer transport system component